MEDLSNILDTPILIGEGNNRGVCFTDINSAREYLKSSRYDYEYEDDDYISDVYSFIDEQTLSGIARKEKDFGEFVYTPSLRDTFVEIFDNMGIPVDADDIYYDEDDGYIHIPTEYEDDFIEEYITNHYQYELGVNSCIFEHVVYDDGEILVSADFSNLNSYPVREAYRWRPSKTQAREFAKKMEEIDDFCRENGIRSSSSNDSYYFTINGQKYRVSNHSVEASNSHAYNWAGEQVRPLYHANGREDDTIYIHASKTRIMDIYNDLKNGYTLDGRGNRKY